MKLVFKGRFFMTKDEIADLLHGEVIKPETIKLLKQRYGEIVRKTNDGIKHIEQFKANKDSYYRKWLAWLIECAGPYLTYSKLFSYLKEQGIMDYSDEDILTGWGAYTENVIHPEKESA
jgi:hypothetical protein